MSFHISNVPLPSSSLWAEDQHFPSQELAGPENPSREDQMQEQAAVEEVEDATSVNMEIQGPSERDIFSKEQLQVPTRPLVTILPRENAILSSQAAARLLPDLPPYEWSYWTDAVLRGPKPFKLPGCGLGIVHRRLDNSKPGDRNFDTVWWQDSLVARNINHMGHATMFAVAQALEMAVDQCERISGTAVTKANIKKPGAAEELKRRATSIPWPMPKVVNIFTSSQDVLDSIDSCWLSGIGMGLRAAMTHANTMIEALSDLGVRVHLRRVPGQASELRNRWAREAARNALKPQYNGRKARTKKVHRVFRRRQRDKTVTRPSTHTIENGTGACSTTTV